jgi:hypothetical protein
MCMTRNASNAEVKEAIDLETYLSKYRPAGWNNPLSVFCDIPGINPIKIRDIREYFKSNSEPNFDRDSQVIASLQPGIKFLNQPCSEKYIEGLRAYFQEHPEQPASGEEKENPDIAKYLID